MKAFKVDVQDWNNEDYGIENKVIVNILLMAEERKKGKGKRVADSGEEPFSEHSLVIQSRALLSADESLSATEMIAKFAVNLEAVRFQGSFQPEKTLWQSSDLCQRFFSNCTTTSLCSLKREMNAFGDGYDARCSMQTGKARPLPEESMESLAQLIRKFTRTLTELRIPLSAPVCQATAHCHLLTKLYFDMGGIRDVEAEQSLVPMLADKGRLKTLGLTGYRSESEVVAEAILGTNAQLHFFEHPHLESFISDFYWPRVHHLADHPLKTVRIVPNWTGRRPLSFSLRVFPQLRVFSADVRLCGMDSQVPNDLNLVYQYLDFYSAVDGEEHQLTMFRSNRNHATRIEYMQEMTEESTKPVNSVVVTQLDQEEPKVIFYRGNAVFCIVVGK